MGAEPGRAPATSMWAPLRIGVFRALWLAVLVSNIGLWMQTVGAQWLLVRQPDAAVLVALVQTADMLPDTLFGVVGGVLADTLDRRHLLMAVQTFMVATGVVLTVLTSVGQMPPALLLIFTFLLGSGSVMSLPAYQSLIPELVPRAQITAATTLSSVSVNLARAVGPAVAGVLIARSGVPVVFGLDTGTFLVFGLVAALWHPPETTRPDRPEPFIAALRAGGRYVRHSPVVRRVLLRSALFLVPASALWALLPLVATRRLGQGASGYGLLLGALGAGAVAGSFALGRVRARFSTDQLLVAASAVYAAVLVVVVFVGNAAVAVVALVPAGVAWIAVLSTINATMQLFLPAWVRARGLSVYLTVMFGSQALGAVLWGVVAVPLSLVWTFVLAAGLLVAGAASIRLWPLYDTSGMDRSAVVFWPEPVLTVEPAPGSGPVLVMTTYTIAPERQELFLRLMAHVRRSRLRTGATRWSLYQDMEAEHRFVELFVVASWDEHLRQHGGRYTVTDREVEEQAGTLSDPAPVTSHLIAPDRGE
ncbi:MAG: MFS transporter [Candidatus Dormiibacterota bacterium]